MSRLEPVTMLFKNKNLNLKPVTPLVLFTFATEVGKGLVNLVKQKPCRARQTVK